MTLPFVRLSAASAVRLKIATKTSTRTSLAQFMTRNRYRDGQYHEGALQRGRRQWIVVRVMSLGEGALGLSGSGRATCAIHWTNTASPAEPRKLRLSTSPASRESWFMDIRGRIMTATNDIATRFGDPPRFTQR